MTQTDDRPWTLPLDQINASHRGRIDGHEDFVPFMLEAWWEGADRADWMVYIGGGSDNISPRDAMLHAARVMCSIGPDYLVLSYDTHATSLPVNPKTGKKWGPGEMQKLCDEEGFCETGQMRDNLVVMTIRRSDQMIHSQLIPYHFHKGGLMFYEEETLSEWFPDEPSEEAKRLMREKGIKDGQRLTGIVPDHLRKSMARPPISNILADLGLGPEALGFDMTSETVRHEVRLHQILAGVRILSATALMEGQPQLFAHVIPVETEEEQEILRRSAEKAGLSAEDLFVQETRP